MEAQQQQQLVFGGTQQILQRLMCLKLPHLIKSNIFFLLDFLLFEQRQFLLRLAHSLFNYSLSPVGKY